MEKLSKDDIQKGYSITKKFLKNKGLKIKTVLKDNQTKAGAEKAMEELLGEYLIIRRKDVAERMNAKGKEIEMLQLGKEYYEKQAERHLGKYWKTKKELYEALNKNEKLKSLLVGSYFLIVLLIIFGLYKSL